MFKVEKAMKKDLDGQKLNAESKKQKVLNKNQLWTSLHIGLILLLRYFLDYPHQ